MRMTTGKGNNIYVFCSRVKKIELKQHIKLKDCYSVKHSHHKSQVQHYLNIYSRIIYNIKK